MHHRGNQIHKHGNNGFQVLANDNDSNIIILCNYRNKSPKTFISIHVRDGLTEMILFLFKLLKFKR